MLKFPVAEGGRSVVVVVVVVVPCGTVGGKYFTDGGWGGAEGGMGLTDGGCGGANGGTGRIVPVVVVRECEECSGGLLGGVGRQLVPGSAGATGVRCGISLGSTGCATQSTKEMGSDNAS